MDVERSHVEADPARIAQQAAKDFRAVIALKGARTVVVSPQGERAVCREGNVGLATSGSGDVLAGIIAGLLARGAPAFAATCWGVYLHARAGDRLAKKIGPLGFLARELLLEIPGIMGEVQRRRAAKTKRREQNSSTGT
jgi:NAD(P)H-hydrate repair Nnr-like enzyme with NAD(P)H-hydrate dehydratase domain